jgi:hypothetical protein
MLMEKEGGGGTFRSLIYISSYASCCIHTQIYVHNIPISPNRHHKEMLNGEVKKPASPGRVSLYLCVSRFLYSCVPVSLYKCNPVSLCPCVPKFSPCLCTPVFLHSCIPVFLCFCVPVYPCVLVSLYLCIPVSLYPCVYVSLYRRIHVSVCICIPVSLSLYISVVLFMYPYIAVSLFLCIIHEYLKLLLFGCSLYSSAFVCQTINFTLSRTIKRVLYISLCLCLCFRVIFHGRVKNRGL